MKDKPEFTWKNWWDYHKWIVLGAIAALLCVVQVVVSNLTKVKPDYQMAYVGVYPLDEQTTQMITEVMEEAGTDFNGDGKVTFALHQYPTAKTEDADIALGQEAGRTLLVSDLLECESYFFLLEDAPLFDLDYDILEESVPVSDLNAFSSIEGIQRFSLAKRGFEENRTAPHMEQCEQLWQSLIGDRS